MRLFSWSAFVLLLLLPPALGAQTFVGISGGGGIPDQVVFRGAAPIEIALGRILRLQVEAAFTQRENPSILSKLPRPRKYLKPVINYVEIPVLAKIHLPFEFVDFFGLIGPQLGHGLRLTSTYEEDNLLFLETLSFGRTGVDRFDIGICLGAGMEKTISQGRKIFFDVRYYLGLRDINADAGDPIYNEGKNVTFGFLIPLDHPD